MTVVIRIRCGNDLRKAESTLADVLALSDETAVAQGTIIDRVKTPIDGTLQHNLSGIILGRGNYIQFDQVTESIRGSVVLFGHFGIPS